MIVALGVTDAIGSLSGLCLAFGLGYLNLPPLHFKASIMSYAEQRLQTIERDIVIGSSDAQLLQAMEYLAGRTDRLRLGKPRVISVPSVILLIMSGWDRRIVKGIALTGFVFVSIVALGQVTAVFGLEDYALFTSNWPILVVTSLLAAIAFMLFMAVFGDCYVSKAKELADGYGQEITDVNR